MREEEGRLINFNLRAVNRRIWGYGSVGSVFLISTGTGGWRLSLKFRSLYSGNKYDVRLLLKCDGTRAETRFLLSAKLTSTFKSAGASVQSTTGSRVVCISGSNAVYNIFRGSVKSTGYPLHSPVSPSLPLPCVVCRHISTRLYHLIGGCLDASPV